MIERSVIRKVKGTPDGNGGYIPFEPGQDTLDSTLNEFIEKANEVGVYPINPSIHKYIGAEGFWFMRVDYEVDNA
jgi:hypothetical protein